MTRDAALAHLDTYLDQVRRRLHVLPADEVEEILKELRSHVLDRVEGQLTPGTVERALEALGSPAEVARLNVTERVVEQVGARPTPLRVLRALWRVATVSVLGLFAFLVSLFGYALSLGFVAVAVLKPIIPGHVGLWQRPDLEGEYDYQLGALAVTDNARELLGWSVIPIAVVLGLVTAFITWRLSMWAVRLMARGARRTRKASVEFA